MDISSNIQKNIDLIHSHLVVDKSFDIVERKFKVANRNAVLYYINGFIKDDIMEEILKVFFKISIDTMDKLETGDDFMLTEIPHVSVEKEKNLTLIIDALLSGQTIIYIDGYKHFFILDLRTYPGKDSSEPEKEKTLRGSRDAFIEKLVFNTGFLRRRIRDPRFVCEIYKVGNVSKTDVCVAYIDGVADSKVLKLIQDRLKNIDINALTVGDQSLVDTLITKNIFTPFPKVRYTERPDVAAAHIVEGKFVIIVDNSPNVIILPTTVFDFVQDVNDYYFPLFTGNYLRIVRNITSLATIFLIPIFLLYITGRIQLPQFFDFLKPEAAYRVPMFWQFMILEFAIDGLKLASLNTPSPLGTSLSVIGGLIIGEYAINTGWFTQQSVLYMSIVALAGFSQPSIELSYACKFMRVLLMILCELFGLYGLIGGFILIIIIMARTKTIVGESYFYPLVPFNWKKLRTLIFRIQTSKDVQKS
ncbi:MAG: spore germination protein [Clostridium butyricum]|nr:spore germination protein [Clostridium butyricum]